MSQTIVSPPLTVTLRRGLVRMWDDPDSRGVLVGLAGVILVHLLLWLLAPQLLRTDPSMTVLRPHSSTKQFNIEIVPETFARKPPAPKLPSKFVETNPDAPDNVPDKTENFAAQNQQAAQEKPTPNGTSDRPALEGQKDIHSTQIVSGQLVKQMEQTPIAPTIDQQQQPSRIMSSRPEQNPLPGVEKRIGDDANSIGTNIAKFAEAAKNIPQKVEGRKDVPLIEGAESMQMPIDPRHPRPRPQIVRTQQVRPAIFEENKFGTANVGIIGVSAKFSRYGLYLQKLIDTVQITWDTINRDSRLYPPSGSTVVVTFILNSEGKVSRIVNVDSKATDQAARTCTTAITRPSPYGPWTDDMKALLGDEQQLVFYFYYQ
ncbi:MAG: hypothetical protein JSR48_05935 [Verrucomicrobia bacterium]|nr:hypothetical protein [Verrucomicrobiota bacterium]